MSNSSPNKPETRLGQLASELGAEHKKLEHAYISEISRPSGTLIGVNLQTDTPIHVDFFDRSILENGNTFVLGRAGEGHSFRVQAPPGETP